MASKILITPNVGSTTVDPTIVFQGAGVSTDITLRVPSTGGLSFEGTTGQLFSISDSMSGTIFSANDVSGIPSIEVIDTGLVKIAQYSGNVLLGTATDNATDKLQVTGSLNATGAIKQASNQVLHAGNYTSYSPSLTGGSASGTWGISISGSLTSSAPQLAAATESNSIYITAPSYTTDTPVKLINFDWYSNIFSIGNIRSGATGSNGFGVYYTTGGTRTEIARFGTDSSFSAAGALKQGTNQVLHAGNYTSYSPTLTGGSASGTWGISVTGSSASTTGNAATISNFLVNTTGNAGQAVANNYIGYVADYSGTALTAAVADGALYNQYYSGSWQHQMYGDYRTGQIALRGKNNGTWQPWRTVWDKTNLTNLNQLTNGPGYGTGTVTAVTATTPIVSSGGTAPNITHATSGATAGTYNNVTVNTFGHVTAGSNTAYLTTLSDTLATVTARGATTLSNVIHGDTTGGTVGSTGVPGTALGTIKSARMMGKYTNAGGMGSYYMDYNSEGTVTLTDGSALASLTTTINCSGNITEANALPAFGTSFGSKNAGMGFISGTQTDILKTVVGLAPVNTGAVNAVLLGYLVNGPRILIQDNDIGGTTATNIITHIATSHNFVGAITQGGNQVLHAGNYTSYSPSLIGGSASGTWGIAITGNAATATTLQTARTINGVSFNGSANITLPASPDTTKLPLAGGTMTGNILFSDSGTAKRGIQGTTGGSDMWFVGGGATVGERGWVEIATGDDGQGAPTGVAEPVMASQYGPGDPLTGTLFARSFLATAYGNHTFPNNFGIGFNKTAGPYSTTEPAAKLAVVSTTGVGTANSAWSSAYSVFGPNAASTTGAALGLGYNTTADAAEIIALAPSVSWRMLNIFSAGITFNSTTGGLAGSISASGSNLTMSGNITAYSDERLKKDWAKLPSNFIEQLSKVKSGTYTRIDNDIRQAGSSAQDWQTLLPEVVIVSPDENKTLSLAYGNAALVSAVELAKEVVSLNARIARLENLVSKLIEG